MTALHGIAKTARADIERLTIERDEARARIAAALAALDREVSEYRSEADDHLMGAFDAGYCAGYCNAIDFARAVLVGETP